ncbi:acyltransferase GLAUCE-like [Aristolochia californica]|uniref:acyltransferase GLAUCE-like n=1 Tax=Aristolochia californica TaxID=171875 RepID=UPI0035DCB202
MGTLPPTLPPLQDLRVHLLGSSTVVPSQPTERRSMFLSNIDQVLNFDVQTVHFFLETKEFPPETVAEKLEIALGRVLVPYDFLAGRSKVNPEDGRLEIDCNGAGVGLTRASSELSLEEIGDLVYPNPAFRQLVVVQPGTSDEMENRPLLRIQVTSFRCGAFAIGISASHLTLDGISFKMFLDNLAAFAAGKPLAVVPFHDRRLLAARSPPQATFPHPELQPLPDLPLVLEPQASLLDPTAAQLLFKLFHLTSDDIANLKEKAKRSACASSSSAITGFNVVTAHVWRCKVLATAAAAADQSQKPSSIIYAVDIRSRLRPPLPKSYAGNAVLTGYGTATYGELKEAPFFRLVEAVREGATRMTDEYARSVIDWGELHKGVPHGDVLVSSWWGLGFTEVDFPWGRAIYCVPVVIPNGDIVILLPDKEGTTGHGTGVYALVGLPSKYMENFESLFYNLQG